MIFRILAPDWAPILGSRFQRVEHGQTSKELMFKVGYGTKKSKLEKVTLDKPEGVMLPDFALRTPFSRFPASKSPKIGFPTLGGASNLGSKSVLTFYRGIHM